MQRRLVCEGNEPKESPDLPFTETWEEWLLALFPLYFCDKAGQHIPFASFHREFWAWVWGIERGVRPWPLVACWARGAGKSTNAEMACVAVGARKVRRYGLYVSGTQEQADGHVQSIGGLLESPRVENRHSQLARRKVGKYGASLGWRRNRLRTESGMTVDALGLDVAARGIKIDEDRPDFIIFDDVDSDTDSAKMTEKKINAITRKLIPAGSEDVAILFVQNLVHAESIMARMIDGRADFLVNRQISGPFPSLRNLKYEEEDGKIRLTAGEPTWAGMSRERCQAMINDEGFRSFMAERQHEKQYLTGAMYADVWHSSIHVVEPFVIPSMWSIDRAFDWGSSKPFATLWFAESNGEEVTIQRQKHCWPKGTLFVIAEDYGWNGKPNEGLRLTNHAIAERVLNKEQVSGLQGRVKPGPADNQIFTVTNGQSIAVDMASKGVRWEEADKGPGSRVTGWKNIYDRLKASLQSPMESPGLFIFATCPQTIRILPLLPRDVKNADDIDSESEDHIGDVLRYRALHKGPTAPVVVKVHA